MHPKFVKRLAKIYVEYLLQNKERAREWAHRIVPKEDVPAVGDEARKIIKAKGIKVID